MSVYCKEYIDYLKANHIQISMDGRGRALDNVFIERLWRSLKYEDIYLREYQNDAELAAGVRSWMQHYKTWRPHQALADRTPMEVYRPKAKRQNTCKEEKVAAWGAWTRRSCPWRGGR